MKISKNTVLSRMLKISKQIRTPYFQKLGCKFEVDELWSFVGSKKNITWITYAIERQSREVIDCVVGRKTTVNIKPLIDKLLLLHPRRIYTDRLNIYPSLIPKELHKRFQYCTNRIERKNLTLRTHIKRLSRRTICFSKVLRVVLVNWFVSDVHHIIVFEVLDADIHFQPMTNFRFEEHRTNKQPNDSE